MNTEEILKVDVSLLDYFLILTVIFTIFSVLLKVTLSQEKMDFDAASHLAFTILKLFGYGLLAGLIYFYAHKGFQQIDVLTLFTFMLATFEAGHCLSIVVSNLIKSVVGFSNVVSKKDSKVSPAILVVPRRAVLHNRTS